MTGLIIFAAQATPAWTQRIYDWIGYVWLAVLAVWVAASFSSKNVQKVQPLRDRLLQSLFTVSGIYLLFHREYYGPVLEARILPGNATVLILGFAMLVAGIGFAVLARLAIGRNWSSDVTIKREHELVSHGPYRIVRHPIYAGLLLAMLGTAITVGRLHAFLGVVLVAVGFKIKSGVEEHFMTEQFGAKYLAYREQVKGLVPFVW